MADNVEPDNRHKVLLLLLAGESDNSWVKIVVVAVAAERTDPEA